jgi:Zn-dependent protease
MGGFEQLGEGLIWFVVFLFSTTVHEAMHAWAAYKGGDPTAYHGGQVSLSPWPHIRREPIGMLVVPLLTAVTQHWAMGWASAPYDPYWAARHPRRAAVMAAAGPAGNFGIAIVAFALMKAGLLAGYFVAPNAPNFDSVIETATGPNAVTTLLSVFLVLNVLLGTLNLIPLPPLDGASVATIFLPSDLRTKVRQFSANGMMSMIGLLVAWRVFPAMTGPLFDLILKLLHPSVTYGYN